MSEDNSDWIKYGAIGFHPCWKLVRKGRCRKPVGHEGDCAGVKFEGDRPHRWKQSWPGNFCLDCGYDDPNETSEDSLINCTTCVEGVVDCGHLGCEECWDCNGTGCVPNPNMVWVPCEGPPMILFLDFDGVLHPMTAGGPEKLFEGSQRLGQLLVKYPCLKVVIHSSWRMARAAYTEEDLWDFLELEDALRDRYLGVTPRTEPSRWESILAWLREKNYRGDFVILDDMYTSFDSIGKEHLIAPHYDLGMQEADWKELERRLDAHLQS